MHERNIIFLSEIGHVKAFEDFIAEHPDIQREGFLLIPLDAEIEYALTEKGIPFESGRQYRTGDTTSTTLGEEWAVDTFGSERWAFFAYREVSLSRLYFLPMQIYFTQIIYYANIVLSAVGSHPSVARLIVFPPVHPHPVAGSCLVGQYIRIIVDVATVIAEQSGKQILVPSVVVPPSAGTQRVSFSLKRRVFGWGIAVLNLFVTLVRRPRRVRILASDYWKYISPYLKSFDSVEVTIVDRKEALNAGLSNILRFRMRFLHLDAFSQKDSLERQNVRALVKREWQSLRESNDMPELKFRGISMQSLSVRALDVIIDDASGKILKDIDDTYMLLKRLKPDVVELRSTMSPQTHFTILAHVARVFGIPSLEMQHGLEYYGIGSMDIRHSAEYIGVYGPLTQRELKDTPDSSKPVVIGSPRFDVYASLGKKNGHEGVVFLCVLPSVFPGASVDSYDVEEYFQSIGAALRTIPHASAIIKLRPGPVREVFYRNTIASAFEGIPHTIAQFEPLWDLYPKADVAISCYSTATIEALLCGTSLVFLGLCAREIEMGKQHFSPYVEQGAMRMATSSEDLGHILQELAKNPEVRRKLSENAAAFLAREYAFDGKASERAATFIESLASAKPRQELS